MQDILLQHSGKGCVIDAVVAVETLILRVDQRLPEYGVHLFVGYRRTVLTKELADHLAIGTIDDRGLSRTFVLDGRHRGRLTKEPQEIDVDGSQIEEKGHDDRYDK